MTRSAAFQRSRPDTASAPVRSAHRRPGLSRDEEVELAERVAGGDREARDRMVEANLGLVHTIAGDFLGRGLDMDDLVGEGHLGLFRAVARFDPRHGVPFGAYAAHWIKEAIQRALRDTTPTVRLPSYTVRLLTRWRRAERALRRELRPATFEDVASSLGLSAAQRDMVSRALAACRVKREGECRDDGGGNPVAQVADWRGRVDARLEVEDERAAVRRRMARLDDRERIILALRYGLEGEALMYSEIGRRLGLTGEWVRKLEHRALAKLADALTEHAAGVRP